MNPEEYHQKTAHTWESVRTGPAMDWSRQPEIFKRYPEKLLRVPQDEVPWLGRLLRLGAGVTATRIYPGGSYSLRSQPSAGALYPCELYLQARGVEGLDDGIYHYQADTGEICLLARLDDGGMEAFLDDRREVKGLLLLVSVLYYRSSWKYRDRALRYCLLDAGHMIGALEAAALCVEKRVSVHLAIDRKRIGECLSFRDRELPIATIVCGVRGKEQVKHCKVRVAYTEGTGCFSTNSFITDWFSAAAASLVKTPVGITPGYGVDVEQLSSAIVRRRSVRRFQSVPLALAEYIQLQQFIEKTYPIDCCGALEVFTAVNRVGGMTPGIYHKGERVNEGDFAGTVGYLCLEQGLCAASGVTLFVTAKKSGYFQNMVTAGFLGQRIYLLAALVGYGCSGIGAFYDQEVAAFLQTENLILYALSVGY